MLATEVGVPARERRSHSLQVARKRTNSLVGIDTGNGFLRIDEKSRTTAMVAGERSDSSGVVKREDAGKNRSVRLQRSLSIGGSSRPRDSMQLSDFLGEQAKDPEAEWKQIQVRFGEVPYGC